MLPWPAPLLFVLFSKGRWMLTHMGVVACPKYRTRMRGHSIKHRCYQRPPTTQVGVSAHTHTHMHCGFAVVTHDAQCPGRQGTHKQATRCCHSEQGVQHTCSTTVAACDCTLRLFHRCEAPKHTPPQAHSLSGAAAVGMLADA